MEIKTENNHDIAAADLSFYDIAKQKKFIHIYELRIKKMHVDKNPVCDHNDTETK